MNNDGNGQLWENIVGIPTGAGSAGSVHGPDTTPGNVSVSVTDASGNCIPWYPAGDDTLWTSYVPYWHIYSPTKIRLTLSEVEVLRKAARKDPDVRKALEKFGPYIDVEVDFPCEDEEAA